MREALPMLWTLASGDTARDIEEAESLLAACRHNTFKLKVGRRAVAEDVRHVSRIKEALGERARWLHHHDRGQRHGGESGALRRYGL